MYTESDKCLTGRKRQQWEQFLRMSALKPDTDIDQTVTVWDEGEIIATGSRKGNLLKCIAVDPARQGEGLTASVLTALKQEAFREKHSQLFLYTKPRNRILFSPLFFYPVAQTDHVLLMESTRDGIQNYLSRMEPVEVKKENGQKPRIGCIVMNADPFTFGHRYLVETAAGDCDHLYVFVLSEDKGFVSKEDRLKLVEAGTADLKNVTVYETGPYLISSATFPKYFLKDRETATREHYLLDLAVFTRWFVPHFKITHRYAGTEPNCAVTAGYNRAMAEILPQSNVQFVEIPRKMDTAMSRAVSASVVREEVRRKNWSVVNRLAPKTTVSLMMNKYNLPEE